MSQLSVDLFIKNSLEIMNLNSIIPISTYKHNNMKVFDFSDYKQFVTQKIKAMPKAGHGQMLKIAKFLDVHTTMVTHIFKGESNLSVEQALKLCSYFGLNELETEYFIGLVNLERAANHESRTFFSKQIDRLKERALNLKERIAVKKVLSERDQGIFYSAWYFAAIHLLTALKGFHTRELIAEKLHLPLQIVNRVVEFLLDVGMLEERQNRLVMGESSTYVDRDSLLISRHHKNWLERISQQLHDVQNEELAFTNIITLSSKDFLRIREELVQVVEKFRAIADPSEPEELCCLNIDWVKIR